MRIALLSDIHGNSIALDAVLDDIRSQGGVDSYWVLGDLVAIGPDPLGVLQRLSALPGLHCLRGNTDSIVLSGGPLPGPKPADLQDNPVLAQEAIRIARGFAWTQGAVTAAGWLDWMTALPMEQRLMLPDGTRLLAVHASPGREDGTGIHPGLDKPRLRQLVSGCEADLVCVGHTHWPMDLTVDGTRVVNLGSVSNQLAPDLRATYCILDASDTGYRIQRRRVDYDHQAVIAAVERSRHPAAGYILAFQRGERRPSWQQG